MTQNILTRQLIFKKKAEIDNLKLFLQLSPFEYEINIEKVPFLLKPTDYLAET